jgi:tetratricopeptide (TPR) repeat protein
MSDLQAALEHHAAGRLDEADALYRTVLAERPDDPHAGLLFGRLLLARGSPDAAITLLEQAVARLPALGQAHAALADALYGARRTAEAIERYRWAVAVDPALAAAWHGLGRALVTRGQAVEAVACLRQAVTLDPDLLAARLDLARAGVEDGMAHLTALLARSDLEPEARIAAGFACAGLLDRAGRYDEAFDLCSVSNALARQRLAEQGHAFNAAALRDAVDRLIATQGARYFADRRGWGVADSRPVFVVGMPRSGTTLVEQIAASHGQAAGIGEGHAIGALSTAFGDGGRDLCASLAAAHLERLGGAARVVDKTPDNIFHLGLIAVLFPNARIVLCGRDPRDVCLSCFRQDFSEPIPYATDLRDCAIRMKELGRLATHWKAELPLPIYILSYEALVADPEPEVRRLLAFLGLDWDAACLDFHRKGHEVRSASLWQVREPVHTRSVGHWRHYRDHIGVLIDAFGHD